MSGLDIRKYKPSVPAPLRSDRREGKGTAAALFSKDISFGRKGLSDKVKEGFYSELSVLITAGIDIKGALELLLKQQGSRRMKTALAVIKDQVVAGMALSEAIKATGLFTPYEYFSLAIGEETGKTAIILEDLASFFAKKLKQKRQMIQALSYPVIVLCTSFGAVGFMLQFIVPMFFDVFKRFGGELPYLTQLVIGISAWFREYFWFLLFCLVSLLFLIRLVKHKTWFRQYSSRLLLRLPLLGGIVSRVYLARFCSAFGLLTNAKVPLLQAIGLVRQMISFYPIHFSLAQVEVDILAGMSLHESLSKFQVYEPRLVALLKVGEEVNKLDFFFYKLAAQYSDEIEHRSAVLSSAMEPLIIIFLGAVVGVILVAMYLPLFQLSTTIG
jgi:type IV pilus assembly protein PilC